MVIALVLGILILTGGDRNSTRALKNIYDNNNNNDNDKKKNSRHYAA